MNFDIAYERWLTAYKDNNNFAFNCDELLNKVRLLAGILNVQLTSRDESDLLNGAYPLDFCAIIDTIHDGRFKYSYDNVVMQWIGSENQRKDMLLEAEKLARFALFDYIGTLSPKELLTSNLTYFMGFDATPHSDGYSNGYARKNHWVDHLSKYGFTTEVRQVIKQDNIYQAIYANVNDKLKFAMCYPIKIFDEKEFYTEPNFRNELEHLFKEEYTMGMTQESLMAKKISLTFDIDTQDIMVMANKFTQVMNTPLLISLCLVGQMLECGDIQSYLDTFQPDSQMIMDYKYQLLEVFK